LLFYQQGAEALASLNALLQKMPNFADALLLPGTIVQRDNAGRALNDSRAATIHKWIG